MALALVGVKFGNGVVTGAGSADGAGIITGDVAGVGTGVGVSSRNDQDRMLDHKCNGTDPRGLSYNPLVPRGTFIPIFGAAISNYQ